MILVRPVDRYRTWRDIRVYRGISRLPAIAKLPPILFRMVPPTTVVRELPVHTVAGDRELPVVFLSTMPLGAPLAETLGETNRTTGVREIHCHAGRRGHII